MTVAALPARPAETVAARVQRLQAEARALAQGHVALMIDKVSEGLALAAEISEGGEAYPVGVREAARQLVESGEALIQTTRAVLARSGQ